LTLSRVDYQEFNLFKSLTISNVKYSLRDLISKKAMIIQEINKAINGKSKIKLKINLRMKNIESKVTKNDLYLIGIEYSDQSRRIIWIRSKESSSWRYRLHLRFDRESIYSTCK
jgi:hypothetical protein